MTSHDTAGPDTFLLVMARANLTRVIYAPSTP